MARTARPRRAVVHGQGYLADGHVEGRGGEGGSSGASSGARGVARTMWHQECQPHLARAGRQKCVEAPHCVIGSAASDGHAHECASWCCGGIQIRGGGALRHQLQRELAVVVVRCSLRCGNLFQIFTHKNIFVIDLSGSMMAPYTNPDGSHTTRLASMKTQLIYSLGNMTQDQSFQLVTFSTTVTVGQLKPATRYNIFKATNTIKAWTAHGATATKAALTKAYAQTTMAGQKPDQYAIYLLSDGLPDAGGTLSTSQTTSQMDEIKTMVGKWKCPIQTFAWLKGGRMAHEPAPPTVRAVWLQQCSPPPPTRVLWTSTRLSARAEGTGV